MNLLPGDVMLYDGHGKFSWLIKLKTWHQISHVEIYLGLGLSAASRDGQGVNLYPTRYNDLAKVWRPKLPFNAARGMSYAVSRKGEPYGWLDLFAFIGKNTDHRGVVCSPFVTDLLRDQSIDPFNGEESRKIAPFQFLLSPLGTVYGVSDGEMAG